MADIPFLPYGRQSIDEGDIQAVVDVLRSDWVTTGPMVERFESSVASFVGAAHAVAVSSGTAALHAAMAAIGIGPEDEVILPPMTFVATANAIVYQGGTPVFVDVGEADLLIDPTLVEEKITPRTKAIIAVDYAGQPCDYDSLREIADKHGLYLISDACHSLGAEYRGRKVGTLADLTVFSFHPVKPITTGEGGMVVTDNPGLAERMRRFRNHGITTDHWKRSEKLTWSYEMTDLGYNYRLNDIQAALGVSQLAKLPSWILERQTFAAEYERKITRLSSVEPLFVRPEVSHGYHLYVVRAFSRAQVFQKLRHAGIGCTVHYPPVHLHPFYRQHLGTSEGICPVAEVAYRQILSLPVFPNMPPGSIDRILSIVSQVAGED